MPKLTDTQRILLSAASQRDNGSLYPLPKKYGAGSQRTVKALAGIVALGFARERATSDAAETRRLDGDLGYGLYATSAGYAAIGVDANAPVVGDTWSSDAPDAAKGIASSKAAGTKAALVLGMLKAESGATLPELTGATGWLPHTTRAALTGLRKKGHAIERGKRGNATCYSIKAG